MALVAANVRVGVTGGVYRAPLGTALPTDATSPIPAEFLDVGYIHEDGVTQSQETDTEDIVAWQNGDVVRKVQTSHDLTFTVPMIETKAITLGLYYNDDAATDSTFQVTGAQATHYAWIIDVVDGDHVVRMCLPDGQVTEKGEVTYQNSEAVSYEITLSAYPDVDGVKAYGYVSGGAEPTPPPAWTATTAYAAGDQVTLSGGEVLEADNAGTSGTTEPTPPAVGGTVVDGDITWTRIS